jgi:tetratricopeptide (TPR) repeat protein
MSNFLFFIFYFALIFTSIFSYAFDAVFTESEYRMLSQDCKNYYSVTQIGRTLSFTKHFSAKEHRDVTADAENAGGAWHYCAGMVYMSRAAVAPSKDKKQYILNLALREISFSSRKISEDHRMYGEMQLNQAKVIFLLGKHNESKTLLQKQIIKNPDYLPARIELASQLAKKNKIQQAVDLLLATDSKWFDKSADLNYATGLYMFKLAKYDQSYPYAKRAYQLRYPLPWLRNQLKRKGFNF